MKKIKFNDNYGFTDAVLMQRKTMYREIHPCWTSMGTKIQSMHLPYLNGETIAIARAYSDLDDEADEMERLGIIVDRIWKNAENYKDSLAYNVRSLVKAEYMPDRIIITDVYAQRLQDITEQDCIDEGIIYRGELERENEPYYTFPFHNLDLPIKECYRFKTGRDAYKYAINNHVGFDIWTYNPLMAVYKFKLESCLVDYASINNDTYNKQQSQHTR